MKEEGVAEALLRERLPRRLVGRFAGPPVALSESWVDDQLRGSLADVVLKVPLRGGSSAFVVCLVEHKRNEEPWALLQILRYLVLLFEHFAKRAPAGRLPVVVPLVVYNGARAWLGARRFRDLFGSTDVPRRRLVNFEPIFIDLGHEPISSLSRHHLLKGGLLGLKAAATPTRDLDAVLGALSRALSGEDSTLRFFLEYLSQVSGRAMARVVKRAVARHKKESVMETMAEMWIRQGRAKGRAQGRAQGRAEGLTEGLTQGLRDSVRRVLSRRFKQLPATVEQRLARAKRKTLERWLDAAIDARSLKAIFGEK